MRCVRHSRAAGGWRRTRGGRWSVSTDASARGSPPAGGDSLRVSRRPRSVPGQAPLDDLGPGPLDDLLSSLASEEPQHDAIDRHLLAPYVLRGEVEIGELAALRRFERLPSQDAEGVEHVRQPLDLVARAATSAILLPDLAAPCCRRNQ